MRALPVNQARGLTILEVVMATVLLGLISMTMFSVIASAQKQFVLHRQRLGAAELCNRLIVMYLDNPDEMPSPFQDLDYGVDRYRYSMRISKIHMESSDNADQLNRNASSAIDMDNRLEQIAVKVWLHDTDNGSESDDKSIGASMARLLDPLNIMRNPDSAQNMIDSEAGRTRLIEQLLGNNNPASRQVGGQNQPGTPGQGSTPGSRNRPQ